jgi:hypothetical protein
VIDYFDHFHLISKKRNSYNTWKDIYYALKRKDHLKIDKRLKLHCDSKTVN